MTYQNGKVIAMSLALSNEPSPAEDIYSTEETRIGTWIDGKPLYRRVAVAKTPSIIKSPTNVVDITDWQTDRITSIGGCVYPADGQVVVLNQCETSISSTANYVITDIIVTSDGKKKVRMNVGANYYLNFDCIIILEYTKTTDQSSIVNEFLLSSSAVDPSIQEVTYAPASSAKTL